MRGVCHRVATLVGIVILGTGIVSACAPTTPPADSGAVLVYENSNFGGAYSGWDVSVVAVSFTHASFTNGDNLNDEISSVQNASTKWAVFYVNGDFTPRSNPALCLAPGQSISSLHLGAVDMNDEFSSMDFESKDLLLTRGYRCAIYKGANGWTGTGVDPTSSLP
ncbi:MAG TPA: peptidase inhibitor family I36 protein [Acidimicrobiia bacterium]|jgi:Peptidase inhibitor family I36|nr:peptidase inhibitor family I36 protein [Acidimicrobiia bacterium]